MKTHSYDLLPLSWWQNPWYVVCALAVLLVLSGLLCAWYVYKRKRKPVLLSIEDIKKAINDLSQKPLATNDEQQYVYSEVMKLLKILINSHIKKNYMSDSKSDFLSDGLTDQECIYIFLKENEIFADTAELRQMLIDAYMSKFGRCILAQEYVKKQLLSVCAALREPANKV